MGKLPIIEQFLQEILGDRESKCAAGAGDPLSIPLKPPVMALDVGKVRIGIAISDSLLLTAQPHGVLQRKRLQDDLRAIETLVREHGVETVVVGWPRSLAGGITESTQAAERFAEELRQRLPAINIELWDERLSTVQAQAALIESGMRRGKRKQTVDKVAAALILQNYLDSKRSTK